MNRRKLYITVRKRSKTKETVKNRMKYVRIGTGFYSFVWFCMVSYDFLRLFFFIRAVIDFLVYHQDFDFVMTNVFFSGCFECSF